MVITEIIEIEKLKYKNGCNSETKLSEDESILSIFLILNLHRKSYLLENVL